MFLSVGVNVAVCDRRLKGDAPVVLPGPRAKVGLPVCGRYPSAIVARVIVHGRAL